MSRFLSWALAGIALISAGMLLGCGATSEPEQSSPATTDDSAVKEEPQSEIEGELAKLPAADRELAEAQEVCPVSGQRLGSMGPPIKVTVDGRSLFVCCAACEEEARKNFDDHFAKLGQEEQEEMEVGDVQ